jgi:hypothetical protein
MNIIKKNVFIVLLVLAVIYVYAPPSRQDSAKLPWLDETAFIITSMAPAKPEAGVSPAAAQVVEDLDYRIAQRIGSIEGWRSFLAAHENGLHAQSARAEVEKLHRAEKPPALVAAAVSNNEPPATKAAGEAIPPSSPSPAEAASLSPDETCRRDGASLERLSSRTTIDEAMRFVNELRCEKLRRELFRLTERLDYEAPSVAVVPRSPPLKVGSAQAAGKQATQIRTRWVVSSRSLQPRRHANRCQVRSACSWGPPRLPPILLALFGDEPKHSNLFVRMRIGGATGGVATNCASSGASSAGSTSAGASGAAAAGSAGPGGGDSGGGSGVSAKGTATAIVTAAGERREATGTAETAGAEVVAEAAAMMRPLELVVPVAFNRTRRSPCLLRESGAQERLQARDAGPSCSSRSVEFLRMYHRQHRVDIFLQNAESSVCILTSLIGQFGPK